MILRSVSDCSVPLSLLIVIFLSSLNYFFYLPPPHISLYSFPLPPTSSTSLYSVITLVFSPLAFHSVILLLLSFPHPASTFLPPDSHSSLLFISPYPLIYHPTCPCAPCSPPAPFHPVPILTFLFRYPCCFAAISHFNLGTSSHLLESNKTSTAVKSDRTVGWKISMSVVRLPRCQLQNHQRNKRDEERGTKTKAQNRKDEVEASLQSRKTHLNVKGKDERRRLWSNESCRRRDNMLMISWWPGECVPFLFLPSQCFLWTDESRPRLPLPSLADAQCSSAFKQDLTTCSFR